MKQNFMRTNLLVACGALAVILLLSFGFGEMSKTVRAEGVAIDETNFPDSAFRGEVEGFDKNNDGIFSDSELAEVKELNVSSKSITDLKGIEYFTALETLDCSINQLSNLDVSKNTALNTLECYVNQLTTLDVSKNTALETLFCHENQLTSLDVSKNTKLKCLDCNRNQLTSLDVNKNTALTNLSCFLNLLTHLDVSKNTALEYLHCHANKLTSLDVSKNTELTELRCYENQLTSLDVSKNTKLKSLDCYKNQLANLDVSKNTELTELLCYENQLTSLDVSKNTKLKSLDCNGNQLVSLDVSTNTELTELFCDTNKIASINIGKCPFLVEAFNNDPNEVAETFIHYFLLSNFRVYQLRIDKTTDVLTSIPTPTVTAIPKPTSTPMPTSTPVPTNTPVPTVTTVPETPTPTLSPTPVPTEAPTIGDFVERLYTVALNRASDADGKKYWVDEIKNGNKTGGECAHFFLIDAPEFLNRGLSNADFVETLYQTFFGRESEPAGKAYWVGELKKGAKTREDVIGGFIDSTEWCNICATYGVKAGAPTAKSEKASENAKNFATRLYTCCLGRNPETDGLNYWGLALTNLEKTGCEAAGFFFTGAEFKGLGTSNEEYVKRLYKTFMDRTPAADEVKYWVGQIKSAKMNRRAVLQFFGQCEEFTNICAKYGIDRGTI